MEKKNYQKLHMEVVRFEQGEPLLAGSDAVGFSASRQSYGVANTATW
jgi:hypothetical protein